MLAKGREVPKQSVHEAFRYGFGVAAVVLTAQLAAGQQYLEVLGDPVCKTCRVELRRTGTLGAGHPDLVIDVKDFSVTAARGGLLIAGPIETGGFAVFDTLGRLMRRLGRTGDGPGEYRAIWNLVTDRGDSILVVDRTSQRLTFLAPSGSFVRRHQLPVGARRIVRLPRGQLVAAAIDLRPDRAGLPLHLIDSTGKLLRSFGTDKSSFDISNVVAVSRLLAPASGGGFWAVHIFRYEMERWSDRLEKTLVVSRKVPWLPPLERAKEGQPDEVEPAPRIFGVQEGAGGRLWVFAGVPRRDWKPTAEARPPGQRRERPSIAGGQLAEFYETVIEVFDVRTGQLLASQHRPEHFGAIGAADLAYSWRETPGGELVVDIWRISLVGDSPRRP